MWFSVGYFQSVNINEHHTQTKASPATPTSLTAGAYSLPAAVLSVLQIFSVCDQDILWDVISTVFKWEPREGFETPGGSHGWEGSSKDVIPNFLLIHQAAPAWTQCGKGVPEPSASMSFPREIQFRVHRIFGFLANSVNTTKSLFQTHLYVCNYVDNTSVRIDAS